MTESDIQAAIVAYLRAAGWYVRQFSGNRAKLKHEAGWCDVFAARRGMVILIEVKAPGGRWRPQQEQFYDDIGPHLWSTLRYVLARSVEDVIAIAEDAK